MHQLLLARESSTARVLAPECGWPDERVSGNVWQILECWRDLDFARGGSNTYELFTDGKKNDKLLTDAIQKCREDIEGSLGMLCKRGPLRYLSGSACESDAITLPAETVKNIETILRGLRPIQLVACKGAGVLKDVKRSQITKPRRKKACLLYTSPSPRDS